MERADAAPDKQAIAEQVIVSAGNILLAVGFRRDEIEFFFRQAADHLSSGQTGSDGDAIQGDTSGAKHTDGLKSEFYACPPVRELAKLRARAESLASLSDDPDALKDHFDLAMQMVPHIAGAQDWLRGAADKAGLRLQANRREARPEYAGKEPNTENDIIFLEDLEAIYDRNFLHITSVINTLVEQGDEDAFKFLLGNMVDNAVVITYELKEIIEKGVNILA